MTSIIDSHCHLYFDVFSQDIDQVIRRAIEQGVEAIVVPGIDVETSLRAVRLADEIPQVYAAVGIHPNSTHELHDAALSQIEKFIHNPKVIAMGEIGLDYYRNPDTKTQQKHYLKKQLDLAGRHSLPVILHNRNAIGDILELVQSWVEEQRSDIEGQDSPKFGVFHSFSEDNTWAERVIQMGFFIGISGVITYPKNYQLSEVVSNVPSSRILVETDAPFLPPQPYRGKRNEPSYLPVTIQKIASILNTNAATIADLTSHNAKYLFGIN